MKLIKSSEVYNDSDKSTKKRYLKTDAICTKCGVIFNSYYEDDCVICYDEDKERCNLCDHSEFVIGEQCVYLRNLLDMHIEELGIVNAIYGYLNSNRNRMTINIMKKVYLKLDKKINESLIKKIIYRNRRRFWYMRDIEIEMCKISVSPSLSIIEEHDCVDDKDLVQMKDSTMSSDKDNIKRTN